MFRTIPLKAKFSGTETLFWEEQARHANSLINCAIWETRQAHFALLEQKQAFTLFWREDKLIQAWKTYRVEMTYNTLDKLLKQNEHYR